MTHDHCYYRNIDGLMVHINGNPNMTPDVEEAITKMVRLARNYIWMKKLWDEHILVTLGYDDPYRQ